MKTEHILVIRFSALGDVAMVVPVISSLARQYPDVRITMLSRSFARPLFEGLAPNVSFMEADLTGEYNGVRGLNSLYRRLVAKRFTAIADLHDVLRSKFLRMRFDLARYRVAHINKHRQGKRQLVSARGKVLRQQPTSIENYAQVFEKLGYPVKLDFTSLSITPSREVLQLMPVNHRPAFNVGLAPFAAHEGKVYPLRLTETVIRSLGDRHEDLRVFLFGGGDKEMAVFHEWAAKYPCCVVVGDHLKGLQQELALMSLLDVMVSMDSANMHLASLVALPVVSVWGATHPYAGFMGYNQKPENAVQLDLPCRPCSIFGNKPCQRGDLACLNNISPDLIIKKVENILLTPKTKTL
ncbi:MAG: glycosyltransferase family 9 protein [Prevotella sp.]|nr:glycosyltransferase family 9 protein [Prevotella sp.]